MNLLIDGVSVLAKPGESIRDLLLQQGLDGETMSDKVLAAKIAGEVFNLNYIPVRHTDVKNDNISLRRAMEASHGCVQLIRYRDSAGKAVYTRTSQFVIFLALHRLYPNVRVKMNCTLGNALYVEVQSQEFCIDDLRSEIQTIIDNDIPLVRKRLKLKDAISYYVNNKQLDKAELLKLRVQDYFDVYEHDGFMDYYYGELAPSTGYLLVFCSYILMIILLT